MIFKDREKLLHAIYPQQDGNANNDVGRQLTDNDYFQALTAVEPLVPGDYNS